MKITIVVVTAVVALASPAAARSLLETLAGVKFCQTVKEDAQRLKCFDGLFAEKPSEPKSEPDVEVTWEITDSKSPIDDSPQVSATLTAKGSSGGLGLNTIVLMLRCREKTTDAAFGGSSTYLGSEPIKVIVRIGGAKPIEAMWPAAQNGRAAFAPNAIAFIRALPDNEKLFVRAFGYGGKSLDGEFNLGGVSEVREKIARACNWPAPKPPQAAQPQAAQPPQPSKK